MISSDKKMKDKKMSREGIMKRGHRMCSLPLAKEAEKHLDWNQESAFKAVLICFLEINSNLIRRRGTMKGWYINFTAGI